MPPYAILPPNTTNTTNTTNGANENPFHSQGVKTETQPYNSLFSDILATGKVCTYL